jgi:hypothetical protein
VEQHLGTNAHAQYIHAHTYMHAYTYIHTCIHIHTYIHAHTYIHTYMYMHTYVHTCVLKRGIVVKTLVLDRQSLRDLFIMLFLYAQSALFFNIFSSKIYLSCQIFHFFCVRSKLRGEKSPFDYYVHCSNSCLSRTWKLQTHL